MTANTHVKHELISLQARLIPNSEITELTETGDGELDDLAIDHPASFRLERMSETHVWAAVDLGDGKRLMINFTVDDGRLCLSDELDQA